MASLILVAGLFLCCVTESLAEATCKFKYDDIFGFEQTKEFQCPDCCCDEPYKSYCCRCWWWNVIGPCVGLFVTICVGISVFCIYRHKQKQRRTQALRPGQVLQPPPNKTGVQNRAYSQSGAPIGGQTTSFQPTWTFSSSGQPANPGQAPPPVSYPGQAPPPVSYTGHAPPPVSYPDQQDSTMANKQLYWSGTN